MDLSAVDCAFVSLLSTISSAERDDGGERGRKERRRMDGALLTTAEVLRSRWGGKRGIYHFERWFGRCRDWFGMRLSVCLRIWNSCCAEKMRWFRVVELSKHLETFFVLSFCRQQGGLIGQPFIALRILLAT